MATLRCSSIINFDHTKSSVEHLALLAEMSGKGIP